MAYFESEIVQVAALAAAAALLLGLLLGYLWGRSAGRRAAANAATDGAPEPAAAVVEIEPAVGVGVALATLPGMNEKVAAKLAAAGVADVGALWAHGQDEDTLLALCDAVQLEDFALRKWVAIADLTRVAGIEPPQADALMRIGVRSAAALAEANPDRVQNKLAGQSAPESAPPRATVVDWIERAGAL